MPNSVDLYKTRTMLAALETRKPPRTFFLDTFFRNRDTHDTEAVDIDVIRGRRRLAPFVSPKNEGKLVERRGFRTLTYKPPYVKPKMVTTADEIFNRQPGQVIYGSNMSPAQRAAEQVGKDLAELEDMIIRREEWMAAQVLSTGQVRVIGDGVDDTVDFLMRDTHKPTLSGTDLWSASSTATPLDDLRAWKRIVSKDSGKVPTDVVLGLDAYDAFLKCAQITGSGNLFDLRRVNVGQIEPRALPGGVTYIGTITELGLDIWTYEEWYVDDESGEEASMMPAKKVLMGSTEARTTLHYGAIQDLGATAAVPRFPKSWTKEDPSARFLMVQSAPLPAPHEIDAFLCAEVLS